MNSIRVNLAKEVKQKFLRDQIIGMKYDADEFTRFMLSKRKNGKIQKWRFKLILKGCDINVWSLAQLKLLVREFKQQNLPSESNSKLGQN